ncbi:bifunctional acetyl-CoA hydrolase/transferase family protein/GNAT family N-acetyltransferase [Desulfobulbus alkaliphilus]|uniref:bifunctional acetyl-CoA hydrolase/transferase family protein/GNAT family N-acetyltransferase n=1 Tax=Desulfobulbus alkaliphilus TaxID=869814 RepID=UPI0019661F46|nr:bifunctional acetyl-CoA hydrolase/transferase family protein/GNAT family N-acetyltransferase [Desulfobulbus alkaliphilus]MBM9536497.1 GNAT family N-acetyltransferase [Desulfobulbus alkaliphilus]
MEYDSNWQEKYSDMIATPAQALSHLKAGQRVFIGTGCGAPQELIAAMTTRGRSVTNVEIIQLITKGEAPYADKKMSDSFAINAFFISSNIRDVIQEGFGDYTPILLSDVPRLLDSGILPIDIALIQVTPPDIMGRVSLGISVDIVRSAIENASLVIAEVNPNMPWTHGDTQVEVFDLDILVPVDRPILERRVDPPNEISRKIARTVAALIPNGSTIELGLGRVPGYGRIPQVVMEYLHDRKDIGFHTEMISDTIIPLIESGAVTGAMKSIDRGKITASFCMGTKELYDYIDDNPLFSFRPTEYINDANIIGKHKRMVSVNMALEIDLTGQVCSDSVGGRFYSGIGGQIDFNRGAAKSESGRAIITLPSVNREGTRSLITCTLQAGSGVVINRASVHYVVTEYGVAYLHGKSIQERVMSLISIAHPEFREQLFREAVEARYLRPDLARFGNRFMMPVEESIRATFLMEDGIEVSFRSIRPTDEPHMRDLVYNLSQETIYYRFMSRHQRFTPRQIQDFVYIDHRRDVAVVGTVPEAHGEQIIAVGTYYLNEKTNMAEVAFVVRDGWQNKGLGTFLFQHLIKIAKRNGIAGFTAEVLKENQRMQNVFNHSGCNVTSHLDEGVYSFAIKF